MPKVKDVQSLYEQCKSVINLLILENCRLIEEEYGNYDNICTPVIANNIQRYLLSNLPGHVVDELCNSLKNDVVDGCNHKYCTSSMDFRILLSIYFHSNMRKVSLDIRLPCDDLYWISKIENMPKLVILDLKMACSDEILVAVGKACPMLEEINIISRSVSCETSMNALKLKYFVSDVGLKHLCQCKRLKKVMMCKFIKTQYAGRMVTLNGIRDLVKSLPKLQYISYTDIGTIVSTLLGEVKQLPLTHVNDFHSDPVNMRAISKLCPNLQEISLAQPVQEEDNNKESASEVIYILTESNLKLSLVEFSFFPLGSPFENFLVVKGIYLTSLRLLCKSITSNELLMIGKYCRNIENVHMKNLIPNNLDTENLYLSQKEPMFTKLRCIYLGGRNWLPEVILPLCLRHATQLTRICLCNNNCKQLMDDVFEDILSVNSLRELKFACLYSDCLITMKTVKRLLSACPELTVLAVWPHAGLSDLDIKLLSDRLKENNFKIDLLCLDVS